MRGVFFFVLLLAACAPEARIAADDDATEVDAEAVTPIDAGSYDASLDSGSIDAHADAGPNFDAEAFRSPIAISSAPGNAKVPTIAITSDGVVHVSWHDFATDPPSLYYASNVGDEFAGGALPLIEGRCTFPALLAIDDTVHLAFEAGDPSTLRHASFRSSAGWSAVADLGPGKRVRLAVDPDRQLHAIYFTDNLPRHSIFDGSTWRDGDPIALDHEYVNTIRLAAVGTSRGIEIALATSPGGTGYDIRRWTWTHDGTWSAMSTLYTSIGFGSDDVGGTRDFNGEARWVWTEQDPIDPYITGIVTRSSTLDTLGWIDRERGFPIHPMIVVPPDGIPITAWSRGDERIVFSRAPYDRVHELSSNRGFGPQLAVDPDGFTHVVYYGEDDAGIEQIFYSTNREDH